MHLAGILLSIAAVWLVWKVVSRLFRTSPLDNIPGPSSSSWASGNWMDLTSRSNTEFVAKLNAYGGACKLHGTFGREALYVFDPTALRHILHKDAQSFESPAFFMQSMHYIFGKALGGSSGEAHRKQRRMLGPLFSTESLRDLTSTVQGISQQLREIINARLRDGPQVLDVYNLMGRTTVETLGQAVLGHSFGSLTETGASHPLPSAVKALIPASSRVGFVQLLVPWFRYLGPASFRRKLVDVLPLQGLKDFAKVIDEMWHHSKAIFKVQKDALTKAELADELEEGSTRKDIMSILLRANKVAPEQDRMTDDEMTALISLFLFAGSDTTSSILSQILQLLAAHPEAQEKLRSEIREVSFGDELTYEQLHSLPYLDAICRESLRLYSSANYVLREALRDVILPLSRPIRGNHGQMLTSIAVPKKTTLVISINGANQDKNIWGEDTKEWKPERWLPSLPKSVLDAQIPGVYPNLMSFLSGPRSCPGWRFSELEMKVMLFMLVSNFRFSPSDQHDSIYWNAAGVRYPTVGKDSEKPSLPLKVELLKA